jgi:hypothetical protein
MKEVGRGKRKRWEERQWGKKETNTEGRKQK